MHKTKQVKSDLVEQAMQERWRLWNLRDGLQQLVDELGKKLQTESNVQVILGEPVIDLEPSQDKQKFKVG